MKTFLCNRQNAVLLVVDDADKVLSDYSSTAITLLLLDNCCGTGCMSAGAAPVTVQRIEEAEEVPHLSTCMLCRHASSRDRAHIACQQCQ